MPIRPENRHRYPDDWKDIADGIKFGRAGGRCECAGECGRPLDHLAEDVRCRNHHGGVAYATGALVLLNAAHLDHTPENCDPGNLRAFCRGCHLHYDIGHHTASIRSRQAAELAATMDPLFDVTTVGGPLAARTAHQ